MQPINSQLERNLLAALRRDVAVPQASGAIADELRGLVEHPGTLRSVPHVTEWVRKGARRSIIRV